MNCMETVHTMENSGHKNSFNYGITVLFYDCTFWPPMFFLLTLENCLVDMIEVSLKLNALRIEYIRSLYMREKALQGT